MARPTPKNDAALPFHPNDRSFNLVNALYLAHASDIAYHRAPAAAAWERLGLETIAFRNKITRTRGFLGVCDTHAVLAFRGSDPVTLQNWLTDVVVKLVECGEYDGRVHYGFSSVLRRTWGKVETILQEGQDKPLFYRALDGGCLISPDRLPPGRHGMSAGRDLHIRRTRVGDHSFCAGYALATYRVVNRLDLVPEMPLASLKRLLPKTLRLTEEKMPRALKRMAKQASCYGHVKTLVYIDHDGVITTDADVEPWHTHAVSRAIATRGKSFLEGITDHLITNYIRGLEGQVSRKPTGVRRRSRKS